MILKNIEKYIIVILIFVIVGALGTAFYFMTNQQNVTNNYKYTITYYDGYIPGTNYTIEIDNNYDVLLIEQPGCSTLECAKGENYPAPIKTEIKFSSKGKEYLKRFVDKTFNNQNIKLLEMNESVYKKFTEEQKKVYSAIFYNDENIMYK